MMNDTQEVAAQKQFDALVKFIKSIDRPIRAFQWRYSATMKEPRAHSVWRLQASLLRRTRLYMDAGLLTDVDMAGFILRVRVEERDAHRAWLKRKRAMEREAAAGKRKHLPWGC